MVRHQFTKAVRRCVILETSKFKGSFHFEARSFVESWSLRQCFMKQGSILLFLHAKVLYGVHQWSLVRPALNFCPRHHWTMLPGSGSQPGEVCSTPRGHVTKSGNVCGHHNQETKVQLYLVCRGWMVPRILQYTGQPHSKWLCDPNSPQGGMETPHSKAGTQPTWMSPAHGRCHSRITRIPQNLLLWDYCAVILLVQTLRPFMILPYLFQKVCWHSANLIRGE